MKWISAILRTPGVETPPGFFFGGCVFNLLKGKTSHWFYLIGAEKDAIDISRCYPQKVLKVFKAREFAEARA
jgi:hypothetical protein